MRLAFLIYTWHFKSDFIINSLAKDVPLTETFKGVIPFLLSDFLRQTAL
jgi:hypothetical protein